MGFFINQDRETLKFEKMISKYNLAAVKSKIELKGYVKVGLGFGARGGVINDFQ